MTIKETDEGTNKKDNIVKNLIKRKKEKIRIEKIHIIITIIFLIVI